MISSRAARPSRRRTIWVACLGLAATAILCAAPAPLIAHGFHALDQAEYQRAYEDFFTGILATYYDAPVVLGLVVAGLFAGIWKPDGFSSLWPFFIGGSLAGAAVGFWGTVPPAQPAYSSVIAVGLLGAAALNLPTGLMRGIFFVVGLCLTNAVFSGYAVSDVPPFAYVGVAFALNAGVALPAVLVWVSREKLPYGWVTIAWRASVSWVVAIALMAWVLRIRSII